MCFMIARAQAWRGLLFLLFLTSSFIVTSPQVWTGYSIDSSASVSINEAGFTTSILTLSVPVYGAGDAVLLVVNLNVRANADNQQIQFSIFRGGTNVNPGGNIMAEILPTTNGESQSASFSYLDKPGTTGTFSYELRPKFQGTVSSDGQVRQLAAIVIPAAIPATSGITTTAVSTFTSTANTVTGAATSLTTTATYNKVLVSASMSVSPNSATSSAKGHIYRNSLQIMVKALQYVKFSGAGDSRMMSMFYLDNPDVGLNTYQLRAGLVANGDDFFTVCSGGYNIAQISAVAVSSTTSNSVVATDALVLSAQTWTSAGLITNITTLSTSDKVLVTVTINYRPNQTNNRAAFTIMRGDNTNLGNSDSGLQVMKTNSNAESAMATMTYLDSPNAVGLQTYKAMVRTFDADAFTISQGNQVRQIAVFLTSAPITAAPTPAPVTAPPTIDVLDCTTTCSLPTQVNMAVNTVLKRVLLSANFVFQFSLTLPSHNTGTQNILELKDALTGASLIKIDRITQSEALWYWGGTAFSSGLNLANLALAVNSVNPAIFTATITGTTINLKSNYLNYANNGDTYTVTAIDTTNRAYDLYVTNSVNSALGTIAAVSFTSKNIFSTLCTLNTRYYACSVTSINITRKRSTFLSTISNLHKFVLRRYHRYTPRTNRWAFHNTDV